MSPKFVNFESIHSKSDAIPEELLEGKNVYVGKDYTVKYANSSKNVKVVSCEIFFWYKKYCKKCRKIDHFFRIFTEEIKISYNCEIAWNHD